MRQLFEEFRRRNVFRVAIVYIIAGWLTMQVADVMFPALQLPDWMVTAVAALVLIGFPFAMILAWAFEMTPDGIKRDGDVDRAASIAPETGRKLNRATMIILAIAVGFLLFDKFVITERPAPVSSAASQAESGDAKAGQRPSIAVLPFVNMSADADNEYFSDGLSEELLNVLAKIPDLQVAGRTSSFAFKGQNEDLRSIGEQLNVQHILEGSVRKSNARLRITAQLIDTTNGYHLWSETYDREVDDIFAVQDDISKAVVEALKVTLLGDRTIPTTSTSEVEAYELYLQASYLLNHLNEENLQKAIDRLEKAVEIDPEYATAYALLSEAEFMYVSGFVNSGVGDFAEAMQKPREIAEKAVALDPDLAFARVALGGAYARVDWDYDAAQREFEKALDLEPNNIGAMGWLGSILTFQGELSQAEAFLKRAREADPLSAANQRDIADLYAASGRCEQALPIYKNLLQLNSSLARINGRVALCYLDEMKFELAKQFNAIVPVDWAREFVDILITIKAHPDTDWRALTDAYIEKWGVQVAFQYAEIYAWGGDAENAFKWLKTARETRDPGTAYSKVSRQLKPLADDPRWAAHLAAAGLAD